MTTHIRLMIWALQILWGCKSINQLNRIRLWKKTINLYLSFLAFTDVKRPALQLQRAMACALLTSIYDYETDWVPDANGTYFKSLLQQCIESNETQSIALKLFEVDSRRQLSADGLERGSVALRFYWLVIASTWMNSYTIEEIDGFGRKLQIIDDLLDLERDQANGDINCFLLPDGVLGFAAEVQEFLKSDFFQKLRKNSVIYRLLEWKVKKQLRPVLSLPQSTLTGLFKSTRPTTNIYALLMAVISFRFYPQHPWAVIILAALTYYGLTASIMVFNDWIDRRHDCEKGKPFALQHQAELGRFWWLLNTITALTLALVFTQSSWLVIYCGAVWTVGILYSFMTRWFVVNNVIVAACAASPALCGLVYHQTLNLSAILTFLAIFFLILQNEIYKDVEDQNVDQGYKSTLPTKLGPGHTFFLLIGLLYCPTTLLIFHPNPWVVDFAIIMIPILAFRQSRVFLHPELIRYPKSMMRLILSGLLVILLLT